MEKRFYFLISLFLLLGFNSFAQFQEVAQLSEYPVVAHNSYDKFGDAVAVDGDIVVIGSTSYKEKGAAYVFYNNAGAYDTLAILTASNAAIDDEFGSSVSISGDVIIVGAPNSDASGGNSGSAYIFEKPPTGWEDMTETAIIAASETDFGDYFGASVSVSGDVIVVGADYMASDGAAYVFEKPSSGGWVTTSTHTAKLISSDIGYGDHFGYAVSISGEVIVVGVPYDDDGGNGSGSAYVFEMPSLGWGDMTETAKLLASDDDAGDNFGKSVCISGTTIVIGVLGKDYDRGAAYVFEKPTGSWINATETAKLTASDRSGGDNFGSSVSISSDIIVVGAIYDNSDKGSAYVFEKPSGSWSTATETAKITASDAANDEQFGASVSISGERIAIGANRDDDHGDWSGSAYIFNKPLGSWASGTETAKLYPRKYNSTKDLKMGGAVAIEGNIAVIGNDFDYGNFVEVLEFDGLNWAKIAVLKPSDGAHGDKFGFSVDINNDIIMVGSYMHAGTGAAYLFKKPTTGWEDMTETVKLVSNDAAADDYFGYSVALGVGLSGTTAVVGAWNDVVGATRSGSVYVFEKIGAELSSMAQTGQLTASDLNTAIYFGRSVSIQDATIAVGSSNAFDAGHGTRPGAVYVFVNTGLAWGNDTETAKLLPSDGGNTDYFGNSVSLSGDVIVAGAYNDDDNGSNSGSAYVFEKPISGWANAIETAKLRASDAASSDEFGWSVSISGNNVVVGLGLYSNSQGAAYVFEKPSGSWATATTETAKLTAADGESNDAFGSAVAIVDNYILVGDSENEVDGSARAGSAYLFQAPITWTGTTSTVWNTTTNWDFGVLPQAYDDVFIDNAPANQPEIALSADCYDIELAATATLGLVSDASSTGSLIIGGAYTGAADVEFHRYMTGNQWHLTGSPFGDYLISDYISSSNLVNDATNYKMKDYVESSDSWASDYLASAAGVMVLGKGYVVKNATSGAAYFQGTPNTATVNATLTRDGNGWNLLSNPFTSAIAANSDGGTNNLLTDNSSVLDPSFTALYIWDQASTSYKIINHVSSNPAEEFDQDYLQVGQGFFVKSKSGGGSFAITTAMQSHQTTVAFKKTANTSWARIKLSAETEEAKTSTQVSYQESMTRGLDVGYDAGLFNANPNFALYSQLVDDNGVDFMVQCLPTDYEHLIVPIGLDAEAGSVITFKAEVSNLPEDYVAVLEDRELGVFTAFETEQSVYTITLDEANTGTGRFYLHTSFKSALAAADLDRLNFSVYAQSANNQLLINGSIEENTTAKVYDIQGKLVKSFDLQLGTQNRLMFNEQSGIYIIQISNSKGIVSEKVNWVK